MPDTQREKIYPAKRFARGAMTCPSCQYVMEDEPEACPRCGFSGQVAVGKFQFAPPELTRVIDAGNLFTEQEKAELSKEMDRWRKRLPQIRYFICAVPIGSSVDLREFGFWLLNAGKLPEGDAAKAYAILFLIDPKSWRVSVTVGYGLEPMVMDSEWSELCQGLRDPFFRERYGEGSVKFIRDSGHFLEKRAMELEKDWKGIKK